jgi:hypothetical protein
VRLAELSPEQVCVWRLTVPEGHRFEATQALRQVLTRAVAWKLIDENPAKRGPAELNFVGVTSPVGARARSLSTPPAVGGERPGRHQEQHPA